MSPPRMYQRLGGGKSENKLTYISMTGTKLPPIDVNCHQLTITAINLRKLTQTDINWIANDMNHLLRGWKKSNVLVTYGVHHYRVIMITLNRSCEFFKALSGRCFFIQQTKSYKNCRGIICSLSLHEETVIVITGRTISLQNMDMKPASYIYGCFLSVFMEGK